ncbi:ALA-interacting subunit 1 [Hordeum vulgare]|nr:ALA-interacting subunit 1 [Hordeum vulgare]
MSKVSGMKRKKVTTKKPSSTPSAPARRSSMVPFYGAASTAGEVFDERVESGGSNNHAAKFMNLLVTKAVDIDQAPIAGFDYNELKGGIDDHGGEDVVEELIDTESPTKRGSFMDMDEDEDDDGPRNLNKPDGDKKAKEKIKREHEASTLRDNIDAMVQTNEVLLGKSFEAKIELAERKAREKQERWKLLKDVEERRSCAAENKTMANLLAEENRIMTLNRNDMDDINKDWHDTTRREILKRRMLAFYNGGDGFSYGIGTDYIDIGVGTSVGAGTSARGGFGGVDGFGGGDDLDGAN